MAIASQLPKTCEVTIVARDLPGDAPSEEWASPWACAGWVALGGTPREEQMQLDTLAFLRKLAAAHPESSARTGELTDIHDTGPTNAEKLWCNSRVPGFEVLPSADGSLAVKYASAVVDPAVFLPWLRQQLEAAGVRFQRISAVKALGDLAYMDHDVLINASGAASQALSDVKDEYIITDRTYTILVKSDYKDMFVRRSPNHEYLYVFGRHDGTAVIGGISDPVDNSIRSSESVRENLIRRAHESLPEAFRSSNPGEYSILADLTGIRPLRLPNVRLEREVIGGQKVVHAYGTTIGAYMLSFGIGREAANLVAEIVFET
ncbi:FAD dependent oxidoreductase-like protein [Immersiella caudata]|uniref:FAD dependent oxidoreductase-like protein n=1 Tax=Immersiella caudata TaxID=314043 RepID=A0AA40BV31_9PEZI|nr:FAD dependent oxidoreductase-like protein [Immersiella caudata]